MLIWHLTFNSQHLNLWRSKIFTQELQVVNIGLNSFKDNLEAVNTKAIQVDWRPGAEGVNEQTFNLLRTDINRN